jgi:hypothetical protein
MRVDAHVPIPGALIDDGFENGVTCDGWEPLSCTLFPQAGGHSGARACLACCPGAGGSIIKFVPADAGGPYQLLAFVRAPATNAAAGALVALTALLPDGGHAGYAQGSVQPTAAWQVAQAVLPSADVDTSSILARIAIDDDGGCVLIDDVSLVK